MNMTVKRFRFLCAAIADDGRVFRSGVMYTTGSSYWKTGTEPNSVRMTDFEGSKMVRAGMIAPVKKNGPGGSTEKWGTGFLYRITDAGREAVQKWTKNV